MKPVFEYSEAIDQNGNKAMFVNIFYRRYCACVFGAMTKGKFIREAKRTFMKDIKSQLYKRKSK